MHPSIPLLLFISMSASYGASTNDIASVHPAFGGIEERIWRQPLAISGQISTLQTSTSALQEAPQSSRPEAEITELIENTVNRSIARINQCEGIGNCTILLKHLAARDLVETDRTQMNTTELRAQISDDIKAMLLLYVNPILNASIAESANNQRQISQLVHNITQQAEEIQQIKQLTVQLSEDINNKFRELQRFLSSSRSLLNDDSVTERELHTEDYELDFSSVIATTDVTTDDTAAGSDRNFTALAGWNATCPGATAYPTNSTDGMEDYCLSGCRERSQCRSVSVDTKIGTCLQIDEGVKCRFQRNKYSKIITEVEKTFASPITKDFPGYDLDYVHFDYKHQNDLNLCRLLCYVYPNCNTIALTRGRCHLKNLPVGLRHVTTSFYGGHEGKSQTIQAVDLYQNNYNDSTSSSRLQINDSSVTEPELITSTEHPELDFTSVLATTDVTTDTTTDRNFTTLAGWNATCPGAFVSYWSSLDNLEENCLSDCRQRSQCHSVSVDAPSGTCWHIDDGVKCRYQKKEGSKIVTEVQKIFGKPIVTDFRGYDLGYLDLHEDNLNLCRRLCHVHPNCNTIGLTRGRCHLKNLPVGLPHVTTSFYGGHEGKSQTTLLLETNYTLRQPSWSLQSLHGLTDSVNKT